MRLARHASLRWHRGHPPARHSSRVIHHASFITRHRLLTVVAVALLLAALAAAVRFWATGEFERWQAQRMSSAALARRARSERAGYAVVFEWARRLEAAGAAAQAERVYARAAELRPTGYEAWVGWGRTALAAGNWPQAEAVLDKAVQLWPERAEARFVRSALLASTWRKRAAGDDLRAALRAQPDSGPGWQSLGDLEMEFDGPAAAAAAYRRALQLMPQSAYLRSRLGAALTRCGRPNEALPDLEASLKMDPSDMDARYYLAEALAAKGGEDDRSRALREFNRVVTFSSNKSRPWVQVAQIWLREGNTGDAGQALEHAVDYNPNNLDALRLLVEVYRREKRLAEVAHFAAELRRAEAVHARKRALQADLEAGRDVPANLLRLGQVYKQLGDQRQARMALSAAASLEPRNAEAKRQLALLDRLGERPAKSGPGRISAPPQGP